MSADRAETATDAAARGHLAWAALRVLRPHYWLKNVLLFVPMIDAQAFDRATLASVACGAVAFSCAAAANYVVNDCIDRHRDRDQAEKTGRPIAAGHLSPRLSGVLLVPVVLLGALLAAMLPVAFQVALAAYLAFGLAYSMALKFIPVADIACLVVLYDLRLAAGAAAASLTMPLPLLAAGTFIFATLGWTKRVAQVTRRSPPGSGRASGLAYGPPALPKLIVAAGLCLAAGFAATVWAAEASRPQETSPVLGWIIAVLLSAWLGRTLILAVHGRLREDMVRFVITDRYSLATFAALGGLWTGFML